MTDKKPPEAQEILLLGVPSGFFNAFVSIEALESPLRPPLLAFKTNLSSALQVGSMPFQLAKSEVYAQRFNQIRTAERIRCLTKIDRGEIREDEADEVSSAIAYEVMKKELTDEAIVERHAGHTLLLLNSHLNDDDFLNSAHELLRQVLVTCWGGFESFVNDIVRVLLNERPAVMKAFTDNKPYRELLSTSVLLEALEAKGFNLSSAMGHLFCDVVKIDSIGKIRDAIKIALCDPSVDILLKDERLWRMSQQRHLIVHRRGLVDARYIEHTSDRAMIGEHLKVGAKYIESSLAVVRDAGCALYSAAQQRMISHPG